MTVRFDIKNHCKPAIIKNKGALRTMFRKAPERRRLPTLPLAQYHRRGGGGKEAEQTRKERLGLLVALGFTSPLYTCALSTSSSMTTLNGDLILEMASRLDAFSAYPNRTWLPGGAPGGTTRGPEVRPTRSSRTSVRTPQISCAHNR